MLKMYYLLSIFSVLAMLFFSCGPTCEPGQVLLKEKNECVVDTCINFHCGTGASCVVTTNGPKCECPSPFQSLDANGNCYYGGLDEVTCSSKGTVKVSSSGKPYCDCDSGYKQLADGVYSCVPSTLSSFCNGGTCSNGKVIPYFENKPNHGVNFFITGDGYTESDLSYNGKFAKDATKFIGYLMKREPYKKFAKYVNFYIVFAKSKQHGVDLSCSSDTVNSVFNTCFDNPGRSTIVRIKSSGRNTLNSFIRRSGKSAHLKIVILNEDRYHAGTAFPSYDLAIFPRKAGLNSEIVTDITLYHEVGHAFGKLGDEYGASGSSFGNPPALSRADRYPNLSLTNNLNIIKWKSLIPDYNVGAVEGGYYRDYNVWRPQNKCVMRSFDTTEMCPVCKEVLVKRFYSILGLRYSIDDFKKEFPPGATRNSFQTEYNTLSPIEKAQLREIDLKFHNHKHVISREELENIEY